MDLKTIKTLCVILSFWGLCPQVMAEETVTEKGEASISETANQVKKGYRKMKDSACEMVNGKLKCVGQKMKHKAQNTSDSIKAKAKQVKDRID